MTTIQSMMLAVCFGAVMGTFIGNAVCVRLTATRKRNADEWKNRIISKQRAAECILHRLVYRKE